VPFVHRGAYSASSDNNRSGLPDISKEESPWGTTSFASFAQGWRNVFHFFMPNVYAFRNRRPNRSVDRKTACNGMCRWMISARWKFRVRRLPLSEEAADKYRARRWCRGRGAKNFRCANGRGRAVGQAEFPRPGQFLQRQDFARAYPRLRRASRTGLNSRIARKNTSAARISASSCSARFGKGSCAPWPKTAAQKNGSCLKTPR